MLSSPKPEQIYADEDRDRETANDCSTECNRHTRELTFPGESSPFACSQAFAVLARVTRVPIYFSGYVHDDCQHNEKCDCAHEQRVILLPQSNIEKRVNACQSCADHERAHTAAQEKIAIPCDQRCRANRRDQVCPTESNKFRNG